MAAESELEKALCKYAESKELYVRKFTSHHSKVPDRIISGHLTLFLEIKALGEKPDAGQKDEINTIMLTGGFATWTDNYDDGVALIDAVVEGSADELNYLCYQANGLL